jgi:hypothetical protein
LRNLTLPVFFAASALFVAALGQAEETFRDASKQPTGVRLIGARCLFCHGPTLMLAFSRRMLDRGGMDALDAFLAGHHAPDAEARAAIVDFLASPVAVSDH